MDVMAERDTKSQSYTKTKMNLLKKKTEVSTNEGKYFDQTVCGVALWVMFVKEENGHSESDIVIGEQCLIGGLLIM